MLLNFIPEFPEMAADISTIDRHLIWSVRSFYARPEACNSQRVIQRREAHSLFPPLYSEPITRQPPDDWHITQPMRLKIQQYIFYTSF